MFLVNYRGWVCERIVDSSVKVPLNKHTKMIYSLERQM